MSLYNIFRGYSKYCILFVCMCVSCNSLLVTSFSWFIWSVEPLLSFISFDHYCSVTKSCQTTCDPVDCSAPGFPVHHCLPELFPKHACWVSDAIQPSHPAFRFSSCCQSFPASESFPVSQLFTSGGQSIGASASASVLPGNIQGWFPLGLTGLISLQFESVSSSALSLPYGLTLTSIHDYFYSPSFINTAILNISSIYIKNHVISVIIFVSNYQT